MHSISVNDYRQSMQALAVAALVVLVLFAWEGHKGLNLWDEGFLWYGSQRVMLGEVPIRDFMAYDPGRYYWSAALMGLLGDNGIISQRIASAVFQVLGLFTGLILIARSADLKGKEKTYYLVLSAVVLAAWMVPRYRMFDVSLSIFLVAILAFLVENPSAIRYFFAGVGVGLVAVFGRNHGVYGAVASLGIVAWLNFGRAAGPGFLRGLFLWGAGVTVGFAPILLMALAVPGFAVAFWESIRFLFEQKATNIALPVPWPWTVDFSTSSPGRAARGVLVGLLFIGIVAFGVLSVLWAIRCRRRDASVPPAFAAAAFLALPYAHYSYSRADVSHLALGIFPLLVGSLVLLLPNGTRTRTKWTLALVLCAVSIWVIRGHHPGWQCRTDRRCESVEISGSELRVDPGTAADVAVLRRLAERYAPNGQSLLVTPFWPGAYALLERESPMWEIYALFPRPESFEREEIERIEAAGPEFALILDIPLDGRDDLRFRNTHPVTYRYIVDNFDPLPGLSNGAYEVYRARNPER